jgi:MFS family permease
MPRSLFYGWKLLAAFWIVLFVNLAFPAYGAGVINTYMGNELHLSRQMIGLPYSVYMLMSGLPGPLAAMLVNRFGLRFAIIAGGVMVIAGSLLMATLVSSGLGAVLCYGIIVGGGVATGCVVATQTGVARWFVRRRSLALAILLSGGGFGGYAASRLLEFVIHNTGNNWRNGWWVVAGSSIVATTVGALAARERPQDLGYVPDGGAAPASAQAAAPEETSTAAPGRLRVHVTKEQWTYGAALRSPALWLMFASALGVSAAFTMLVAHAGVHLKDLGHPLSAAALVISTMTLASLLAKVVVAVAGDAVDPRYIWAVFTAVCAVGVLLAADATSTAQVYLFSVCVGSGFGAMIVCLMAVLSNYYGLKAYASIVGLAIAIQTTVSAMAPYFAGLLYDRTSTYTPAFYCVAAICFAGAVTLFLIRPPRLRAPATGGADGHSASAGAVS